MKKLFTTLFTIICIPIFFTMVYAGAEQHTISTRTDVTMDFITMSQDPHLSTDAVIMFTGGNSAIPFRLTENGAVAGWNFLIRSADYFVNRGLTFIAVKPPSDHRNGMTTDFRESSEHAEDITHLINYLKLRGVRRFYLAGNSRGTISVASLAAKLSDPSISGVILTSTLNSDFLRWIEVKNIHKPLLMIHHRNDGCKVSSFSEAQRTFELMKNYTKVDFLEVDDSSFYQMSEPCNDLSSHGFFGIEEKVVQVIADWINGSKIPEKIE